MYLLSKSCFSWCFTAAPVCQGSEQDSQPDNSKPPSGPGQLLAQSGNVEASYTGKESPSVCQKVETMYICACVCVIVCECLDRFVYMMSLLTMEHG